MNTKNRKSTDSKKQKPMTPEEMQQGLEKLLKRIRDFVGNDEKRDYIFRGEAKRHLKISSNLYHHYKKAMKSASFDVNTVETHILESVKKHIKEEDNHNPVLGQSLYQGGEYSQIQEKNNAILELLQHYGGKTNQIDFSSDYLIALFFACEAEPEKNGRLIFLNMKKLEDGNTIYKPKNPQNRVIVQKSVFVRSRSGVIKAHKTMGIDKRLKEFILSYLDRYHSINVENIYNDIHGFIYRYKNYENSYTHIHLGHAYYDKEDYDNAIKHYTEALKHNSSFVTYNYRGTAYTSKKDYDLAIADFTQAIKLDTDYVEAYINRSISYDRKGDYKHAIADCNKAIELNPYIAKTFNNRGVVYNNKGDYDRAIADYDKAIELDPNYVDAYFNRNVSYFNKGDLERAMADRYNYVESYINRGITKKTLNNPKGAKKDFQEALRLANQQGNKILAARAQKELDDLTPNSAK